VFELTPKRVASKWLKNVITYKHMNDGTWALKGPSHLFEGIGMSRKVKVFKADGSSSYVAIDKEVWNDGVYSIWTIRR
jgi:hypothetical protein